MNPLVLLGSAMMVVGVLLFFLASRTRAATAAYLATAVRVSGRVVALTGADGDFPTVEFTDSRGVTRRVDGQTNTSASIGDVCAVVHQPGRPKDARIADDAVNTGGVLILLSVVFTATGVVMLFSA